MVNSTRMPGVRVSGSGITFGRHIAYRRTELGWTQLRLAAEVDRSEDWVSQVERDVQQVKDLTLLRRLASALGLELDTLTELPQPAADRPRSRRRASPSDTLTSTRAAEEDDVRRRPFMALAVLT
ncbi:helix-turn-helix domain-containing protein, partial [Streptomyces sp. DpondAA-D4]|uniref:helix-turn-helix domain-containing protein n=1 Tax=Streptomyces sp. DpondAA-D4 TaxID=1839769 RepID=UPI00114D2BC6